VIDGRQGNVSWAATPRWHWEIRLLDQSPFRDASVVGDGEVQVAPQSFDPAILKVPSPWFCQTT